MSLGDGNLFILAQIVGLFAMSLSLFVWQIKEAKHIVLAHVPVAILWGIQFLLLGAPLGALICFLSAGKDFTISFSNAFIKNILIYSFIAIVCGTGFYFYQSWFDLLPIISATAYNIALLRGSKRPILLRSVVLGQLCWFSYNLMTGAIFGVVCAILIAGSAIIGMARHENWEIGKCYRSFIPSLLKSLFAFPNFKTYP